MMYGTHAEVPPDNAAMTAWASMDRFLTGDTDPYETNILTPWPLEALRKPGERNVFDKLS